MRISEAKTLMRNIVEYNIDQAVAAAKAGRDLAHNTFVVPFFVGDPGVGKTAIPRQVARELGLWYGQVIVAQYDAGEMPGLPWMDKHYTKNEAGETEEHMRMIRLRPSYLPDPNDEEQCTGIFNLDELPQAFLANQNIVSQIVNEYRVGEHLIPEGVTMCCTGNKPENKAGTTPMPTHLRDRLMFIEIDTDHNEWLDYAAERRIDPRIRAYIRNAPLALHKFEPGANACPSPRSWEKANAILSMNLDKVIRTSALAGTVGNGAATEFEAYLRVEDKLPPLQQIFDEPTKAPIFTNKEADVLYMLLANLSDRADKKNLKSIITYIERLPNKEFAGYCVSDILKRNKELTKEKPMVDFFLTTGVNLML